MRIKKKTKFLFAKELKKEKQITKMINTRITITMQQTEIFDRLV